MVERREDARLALETALVLRIVRRELVQDLDGDLTAEPDVLAPDTPRPCRRRRGKPESGRDRRSFRG